MQIPSRWILFSQIMGVKLQVLVQLFYRFPQEEFYITYDLVVDGENFFLSEEALTGHLSLLDRCWVVLLTGAACILLLRVTRVFFRPL